MTKEHAYAFETGYQMGIEQAMTETSAPAYPTPEGIDPRPWTVMECKITVSSTDAAGGDFERNDGGMRKDRRVTFDGFATRETLEAFLTMAKEVLQP